MSRRSWKYRITDILDSIKKIQNDLPPLVPSLNRVIDSEKGQEGWRLSKRHLIPLNGFERSKKVIKSGRIRSYSASHAGNAGSNPAGITSKKKRLSIEALF